MVGVSFDTLGGLMIGTWEGSLVGLSMGITFGYPLGMDLGNPLGSLIIYPYTRAVFGHFFGSLYVTIIFMFIRNTLG